MTDKTENRSYNVPAEGEEDWHEPVNKNWRYIDDDVQTLYDSLDDSGGVTGSDIEPASVTQYDTKAPIRGPVIEAFEAGNLRHYSGDSDSYAVVDSTLEGEYMLEGTASDGDTTEINSNAVSTQRGFTYSVFIKAEDTEGIRAQTGPVVLAEFDETGSITDGYQVRLNIEDDELEVLKWKDGSFITGEAAPTDEPLSQNEWYRVEIDADWDRVIGRVYDRRDRQIGGYEYIDDEEGDDDVPLVAGDGFGWRVRSDDGTTVTAHADLLTAQPLSATPGRISSGDATALEALPAHNVFVYEFEDGYEAVDGAGNTVATSDRGVVALQDGIDAAPDGGTVYVDGHFELDETVSLGDGKTLVGYSAQFEINETDTSFFQLADGSIGDTYGLATDAAVRDNHIYLSDVSAFEVGDTVRLVRGETWDERGEGGQKSELHLVRQIDTGADALVVADPLEYDYPTGDGAVAVHIRPDEGHLEGVEVNGGGEYSPYRFCEIDRATHCTVRNVTVRDFGDRMFSVNNSYGTRFDGCTLERANVNGDGYGIRVRFASANTFIIDCAIRSCRHGVVHSPSGSDNGMPRGTVVANCDLQPGQNGSTIDAHDGTINWLIVGNHISGNDNNAITVGARDTYVYNNMFHGTHDPRDDEGGFIRTGSSFTMSDPTISVRGNAIRRAGGGFGAIELRYNNDNPWRVIDVSDNLFDNCEHHCVRLRNDCEHFVFSNNVVDSRKIGGDAKRGVRITDDASTIESGSISNNAFRGTYRDCVLIESGIDVSNLSILTNHAHDCNTNGDEGAFDLRSLADSVVSGNAIHDPEDNMEYGIRLGSATRDVLVRDNDVHSGSAVAIVDNGSDNVIDGNYHHDGSGWSKM